MGLLVATCCIIAAKMEQPLTPSITRMIKLLDHSEQREITKQDVIDLESKMLKSLSFDFNNVSPAVFLERFLRVAGIHEDESLLSLGYDILKLTYSKAAFLEYKPSNMAAAALVLALNL